MSSETAPARSPGLVVAASGVLLPLALFIGLPSAMHALIGAVVLGVLPGYAWVRLASFTDPVVVLVVAVATSLALSTIVSLTLFYAGFWSWQGALVVLGIFTVGAGVVESGGSRT